MSEEILINVTPQEVRVALVANGMLQEIHIERTQKRGLVGNIYKGRVSRVLPGMQAAFIDIGLERAGFLHSSDLVHVNPELQQDISQGELLSAPIETTLREGEDILVQVLKDPMGNKGTRLTTRLALLSRYIVLVPGYQHVKISQRIEEVGERGRLRSIMLRCQHSLQAEVAAQQAGGAAPMPTLPQDGFIVRSAAENACEEELLKDAECLSRLWGSTLVRANNTFAPALIYEDLPLAIRTIRDLVRGNVDKIKIDSKENYEALLQFSQNFIPDLVSHIEYYTGPHPILDIYSVEDEIQRSLNRAVQLKSGGHLIIDQTEAMTTIDVNTGGFVGHRNQEETLYKTNLEAAQVIARQLRLRNLGGIIIIDFIDMREPSHRRQVLRTLEKHLAQDYSRVNVSEMTTLGLVQLTRKRTRESLEHIMCEPCSACNGCGSIKTPETICYEIFREILREVRQFDTKKLLVVASPKVATILEDEEYSSLAELEVFIGKPIDIQAEPLYTQEQYEIVLL